MAKKKSTETSENAVVNQEKGNIEIEITTDWLKDDIGTIKRVPIITSKT